MIIIIIMITFIDESIYLDIEELNKLSHIEYEFRHD